MRLSGDYENALGGLATFGGAFFDYGATMTGGAATMIFRKALSTMRLYGGRASAAACRRRAQTDAGRTKAGTAGTTRPSRETLTGAKRCPLRGIGNGRERLRRLRRCGNARGWASFRACCCFVFLALRKAGRVKRAQSENKRPSRTCNRIERQRGQKKTAPDHLGGGFLRGQPAAARAAASGLMRIS